MSVGHINAFRIQHRWRTRKELRKYSNLLKMGQAVLDTMEKEHIGAKFNTDDEIPKHDEGGHLHVIRERAREKLLLASEKFAHKVPIHKLHLAGKPKGAAGKRKQSGYFGTAHNWKQQDAEMSTEEHKVDSHQHAMEVLSRKDRGAGNMVMDGVDHLDEMNAIRMAHEQEQSAEKEAFLADTDTEETEEEGKQETPAGEAAEGSEGNGTPPRASPKRSPKKAKLLARSPSGVAKRPAGKPKAKRCVRG